MRSTTDLQTFKTFAADQTQYIQTKEMYEDSVNFSRGFEPLETLPATWHNTILQMLTKQAEATYKTVKNIMEELINAIGEEYLDPTTVDNLKTKLENLRPPIANAADPGLIRAGYVSADETEQGLKVSADGDGYVKYPLASSAAGLAKSAASTTTWGVVFTDGVGKVTPDTDVQFYLDTATNQIVLKVNGITKRLAMPSAGDYATCATYLIPSATSTERLIYARASGQISAKSLQLRNT